MKRSPPAQTTAPEQWVEAHGDSLFRYAYLRLRDRDAAEDLVQETLLAALRSHGGFAGNSSERTWLIGILKHKLSDHWRRLARSAPVEAASDPDSDDPDDLLEKLFDAVAGNHWRTAPSPWRDPDAALQQQQFWRVLADCIAALPAAQAQAFSLCELDGLEGAEACKVLDVAPTNLWVMLHRARLRLRQCLENHWFGRESKR
jgi:RNA polymerase sigma-70 factor (ECF subfamily)